MYIPAAAVFFLLMWCLACGIVIAHMDTRICSLEDELESVKGKEHGENQN